ncbi:PKD domain-containing protein, partial [Bacteroidota bacterium]
LYRAGINGPVILNLKDLMYNEQVQIENIPGSSLSNTITIQSSGQTYANWSFNTATTALNYVLQLDSADHIILNKIQFSNSSLNAGRLIDLRGDACNNRITKCILGGQSNGSTSDNFALIYSSGDRDTANLIDSNIFRYGSLGIVFAGTGISENFNKIIGNEFEDQYVDAIYMSNQEDLLVSENSISTNSSFPTYTGIEIENSGNRLIISKNKISFYSEGFSILLNAINADPGYDALVANNFIHAGGNTAAIGIFIETSNYVMLYNNNIHISSSTIGSAGRAINIQDANGRTSHIRIRNNVIVNKGPGFGLITFTTDTITSDYNCFYSPNGQFGYWNGYATNSMPTWWLYTNQDSHSVYVNPGFYNFNDLHVSHKALDSAGLILSQIAIDIDGESRDSLFPDIGADEFSIYKYDVGAIAITDPIAPCAFDSSFVSVKFKNFGTDTLYQLKLNWEVNGILQNKYPILQTVFLLPGATQTIALGRYYFLPSTTYVITASVFDPNLQADQNNQNNSTTRNIQTALMGTYTIGMSGDYFSISDAVSSLIDNGVCGHVRFLISPGIYSGQISINEINGISPASTVTFEGLSTANDSVVVPFTSGQWYANFTLKIGSPWIKFYNINFVSEGTVYGRVIDLVGHTQGTEFKHCKFIGRKISSTSTEFALIYSENDGFSDSVMVFDSNSFIDGAYGLWLSGVDYSVPMIKNQIRNNDFSNQYVTAIQMLNQKLLLISNNIITTNTKYTSYTGIHIQGGHADYKILNNKLDIPTARLGINILYITGSQSQRGLIGNNMVFIGGTLANVRGISIDMSAYHQLYFNSINITNTYYSGASVFINSNASNITIKNNNIVNTGGGYSIACFGTGNIISDHNNLYTTASNFAYWAGNKKDLSEWTTASNLDSNSVSVDPYFYSTSDLHAKAMELDSAAVPFQEILYDIDGELRNRFYPDIGADEYKLRVNDAGITACPTFSTTSCDGLKNLQVELTNFGIKAIDSVYIAWKQNGQTMDTVTFKGNLPYLQSQTVNLGIHSFRGDSNYFLDFYSFLPNGNVDEENTNDSLNLSELSLVSIPGAITTSDTTICFQDSATLQAFATNAFNYFWYDSIESGHLLGTGSVFKTPKLSQNTTYYVEAGSLPRPDSLKTTYTTSMSNLTNGSMFDITAVSTDITIDSFDIHTQYSKYYPVWVFYRKGTYPGHQNDSSAWILVDSMTIQAAGQGKPSRLPLGGFTIPRGETYGIYITTIPVSYLNFSASTNYYSDTNIFIWPGIALDYMFDATYSVTGVFNGQVYYSNGSYCQSEREAVTAYVKSVPQVNLGNDTFLCYSKLLELSTQRDSLYTYAWRKLPSSNILSYNDTFIVNSSGIYTVTVQNTCGNTDIDTIEIKNAFNPVSDFIVNDSSQCLNNNLFKFTNKSSVPLDSLHYMWDFGNGMQSDSIHPEIIFTKDSIFKVQLTAISDKGCIDSFHRNVYVNPMPQVDFSINNTIQCLNENDFEITNHTTIRYGQMTYNWEFGDGSSSTDEHISTYSYQNTGNFTVKLTASSDMGCIASKTEPVTIKENPLIDLGNDTILCADQKIVITPGFSFDEYLWSNDTTQAAILVDSSKTGIGTRTIWVKVTDNGCFTYDTIHISWVICSGIKDQPAMEIIVYPNPTDEYLLVQFSLLTDLYLHKQLELTLISMDGKHVFQESIILNQQSGQLEMNVSELPAGYYLLQLQTEDIIRTIPVMIR